jgi:hypothetical protein
MFRCKYDERCHQIACSFSVFSEYVKEKKYLPYYWQISKMSTDYNFDFEMYGGFQWIQN